MCDLLLFANASAETAKIGVRMLTALTQNYVDHTDGFTMHYGHPLNSDYINHQISLIRQHFFKMQGITVNEYLPQVPCPHNLISEYNTQYTYYEGPYYWGLLFFYRGQDGQASGFNFGSCAFEEMQVEIVVMAKMIVFVCEN